ncbi:MAG: hypothetical protein BMS9Abin05_1944 [Rhodothermia bacterium]|nr:MAG: hypothetical protein BMS9Abin05_1944 [Rhodothermia bacterium]
MVEVLKRNKEQVAADLEERSASISSRIEAIESELPAAPKRVRDLLGKRSLAKVGMAVVAGLLVGTFVFRLRRHPGLGFREELDDVTQSIGKEIKKNLNRGLNTDDAISKALRKRPPIVQVGGEGGSLISNVFFQLSRQIAAALGPVIAEKIAERFKSGTTKK